MRSRRQGRATVSLWRRLRRFLVRLLVLAVVLPLAAVALLNWFNPPTSSVILQHNIAALLDGRATVTYRWTDYADISPNMAMAVIAAEDQRFPEHHGIDFHELADALSEEHRQRGASTITQQTAKNLFLWHGRSYVRKALEAGLALAMELMLSKTRILEIYLNIAQTGKSLYGVTPAARTYFGKSAADLNRFESARIAAILPNPVDWSATDPDRHVLDRQQWIMRQVKQLGGTSYLKRLD